MCIECYLETNAVLSLAAISLACGASADEADLIMDRLNANPEDHKALIRPSSIINVIKTILMDVREVHATSVDQSDKEICGHMEVRDSGVWTCVSPIHDGNAIHYMKRRK